MAPRARIATLAVVLSDSSFTEDELRLAAETDRLKDQIRGLVYSVEDAVTPAPVRSRALDVPTVGAFIIVLSPAKQIVLEVVRLADTWLRNRPTREVDLEIGGEKIKMKGLGRHDIEQVTTTIMEVYDQHSRNALSEDSGRNDS